MGAASWVAQLRRQRAIAVIRAGDWQTGVAQAQAVAAAGLELIEITWNSDRPAHLVAHLRQALPHCTIGVGTILTRAELGEAIATGAAFAFMPHTDPALIHQALDQGIPPIPGALTPTEILAAFHHGAPTVKVFPALALGGVAYIRHLGGPLGHIPLIPTGGITLAQGPALIAAGAIAVGLATDLFPPALVAAQDWPAITERARLLRQALLPFRLPSPPVPATAETLGDGGQQNGRVGQSGDDVP